MATRELFAYLCVPNADAAIAFYRDVFDARETLRLVDNGGRVGHVELALAGTTLMLCEPYPEYDIVPPHAAAPSQRHPARARRRCRRGDRARAGVGRAVC